MGAPKVAMTGRYYNKQGGVSNVMAQIATRAVGDDYPVTVFSHEFLDWDLTAERVQCAMLRRPLFLQTPSFAVSVARKLDRAAFDIVHCHDPQTFGADVYTAHSCFPAYIASQRRAAGWPKSALSRLYPPHVVTDAISRFGYRLGNPLVVSVSRSVRDDLVATQGLAEEDVRVIHNGVDLERFTRSNHPAALPELERRIGKQLAGRLVVVFVGYEFDRKRLGVAISAVARCGSPDVELIVAGKGSPERYRRQAAELGVADRVHFLGHCPDVETVLAAGHVFLFPTKYEAASLALLEAAAAGLAVVTTEVGMAAEMLEDGVSAMLLPNTDDPDPATRALAALADDAALRSRLAAGGVTAASDCGWDRVWQRYRAVYDEVLDRKAFKAAKTGS